MTPEKQELVAASEHCPCEKVWYNTNGGDRKLIRPFNSLLFLVLLRLGHRSLPFLVHILSFYRTSSFRDSKEPIESDRRGKVDHDIHPYKAEVSPAIPLQRWFALQEFALTRESN